jgi:prophage regulatory protein
MRLLRPKQILQQFPISRSTLFQWVKDGKFPAPLKMGARCTVWREEDIQEYVDAIAAKQK